MELLETTASGKNQFMQAMVWVILFNFLLMNVVMEYWKQKALASYNALVVVPLFQVALTVLTVVTGAIYFEEFAGMEDFKILCFVGGLGVVCLGMYIVAGDDGGKSPGDVEKPVSLFTAVYVVMVTRRWLYKTRKPK